jgi:hypothetical protein
MNLLFPSGEAIAESLRCRNQSGGMLSFVPPMRLHAPPGLVCRAVLSSVLFVTDVASVNHENKAPSGPSRYFLTALFWQKTLWGGRRGREGGRSGCLAPFNFNSGSFQEVSIVAGVWSELKLELLGFPNVRPLL